MATTTEQRAERAVLAWCQKNTRDGHPVMRFIGKPGTAHHCVVMRVANGAPVWIDPNVRTPRYLAPDAGGVPSKAHIASGPTWTAIANTLGITIPTEA